MIKPDTGRDVLEKLIELNPCTPRKTSAKGRMLIEKILREVPFEQLFAAMLVVLRMRHEKAGWGEILELHEEINSEQLTDLIEKYLTTSSVHQLKLLRVIALQLEGGPSISDKINQRRKTMTMTDDQNVTFDSIMPNGKRLGDCTDAEIAGFELGPAARLSLWLSWDKNAAALNKLWDEQAAIFDPKDYNADGIFFSLLGDLVSLAKYKGADNKVMMEWLFESLLNCGPKGRVSKLVRDWGSELQNRIWPGSFLRDMVDRDEDRLFRLLYQAYSLMKCGDESIIVEVLLDLYKEGHLTDEEWKDERVAIGIRGPS
jgi:hypothetical protein